MLSISAVCLLHCVKMKTQNPLSFYKISQLTLTRLAWVSTLISCLAVNYFQIQHLTWNWWACWSKSLRHSHAPAHRISLWTTPLHLWPFETKSTIWIQAPLEILLYYPFAHPHLAGYPLRTPTPFLFTPAGLLEPVSRTLESSLRD